MNADSRWFVSCDKCAFNFGLHESASRDFTENVYDFGNGRLLPLIRRRWWCLDCNTISWVESIPSAEQIRRLLDSYKSKVAQVSSDESIWPGKPLAAHYQSVLTNQALWLKWAEQRDGPRCLICGCQQLLALDEKILHEGSGPLGVEHPGCGGALIAGTEQLSYHANPNRWDYHAPIEFARFTPHGFRAGNLHEAFDNEFPTVGPLFTVVLASEIRAASTPSKGRPNPKVSGEEEYMELCGWLRHLVREEMRGRILPREPGNLNYEYPDLYSMVVPFVRWEVAQVKAKPGNSVKERVGNKSTLAKNRRTSLNLNPFAILGATVRDDRKRITSLADEKALAGHGDECEKARSDLTTPSKRLAAEMAWLPGISPRQATRVIASLATDVDTIRDDVSLPLLASANLLAAAIELLDPEMDTQSWCDWLEDLAYAAEQIDSGTVMREINEDRVVAGIPEILGVDLVDSELNERRKCYAEVVRNALDGFEPMKLVQVVTKVVDNTTSSGEIHAPQLIHDIVERYEREALRFLHPESENIKRVIDAIREAAPNGEREIKPLVIKVDLLIRNWGMIAQPIQLSCKAQGRAHDLSNDVAWGVRSLVLDLFNKYDMLDTSILLTNSLRDVFSEITEIVDRLNQDVEALKNIVEERKQTESRHVEWAREVNYSAEVGLIFKDELSISPKGISWKGKSYPLATIARVRWGGMRNSVNGISTGTDYTIGFGDNRSDIVVQLRKESIYSGFLKALWPAVCGRLMFEIVDSLKKGLSFSFGDISVEDEAVTLVKHNFFGSNERVRLGWSDVHVWSADGSFVIGSKDNKKIYGSASYIIAWNTHILEHVVRGGFKKGVDKLSDYLRE